MDQQQRGLSDSHSSSLFPPHLPQPVNLPTPQLPPAKMEGLSRQSSRLIRSRALLQQRSHLRPSTCISTTQSRTVSNSPRNLAPESLFSGFAAVPQQSGGTPTYFNNRPALPANTVVRFVPQQTAWIVERMGKFDRILEPGLALLVPFLDRIAYVKSLKESAIEIPSQNAITADNVTLELDGVLYTRVFDAYKAR